MFQDAGKVMIFFSEKEKGVKRQGEVERKESTRGE